MKRVLIALFFGIIAPGALSASSVNYSQNAQDNSVDPYSSYNQRPIFSQWTQAIPYPATYAEQSSLTLTSAQWGFHGPLDFSVILSHLYGAIVSAQYTKRLGNYNAASLLLDGNDSQHRMNLTWGSQLSDTQLLKMTMEHLSQRIKFNFVTGDDKEWVSQNAYGVEYKFLRPKQILNDVDVKWHYSKAENIDLSSVIYFQNNIEWRNDRRIAGGIAQGGSAGVHFLPTRHTLVGTAVNYSSVHYGARYNTTNSDSHGLGGSVSLEQLLTQRMKVHFLASDVVPLQHYEAGVDYTPKTEIGTHLNLALSVARDIGGDGLRNDSQAILSLNYVWGDQPIVVDATTQSTRQQWNNTTLGVTNTKQDLMAWTHQPAVKMAQVLAIADQRVVRVRNIVMIDLSDNGDWVMSPEVFRRRALAGAEPIKEGFITINTARGSLDESAILDQLTAAKDAQGNQLGSYLNFDVVSENSQEIKISAALRGDSPEFSGSDSFHIAETDTAGDLGEATLKLTMIGTVPVGNDVDTNITKASNEQVTKPLAQGSFSAKTPITDYKICPVNAKEINDCTHSMDGMTISQSGEITVDASAVMTTKTTTHWVIAGDVFGYSVPSATGPKIIITAGDQPIGNNVKTLINTTPSTTIAPHDLEQGSFTSDDAPILDYKLCKMGATNPDDPTQCSTTMGTLKIDAESGKISGTSPAEGNVTDWIVARNKFGYSELKEGGPSVTVATGAAPQGDNVEQTVDTTAKHDVTISFDSIPFSSPTAAISDYDICSSDGTQCGHTIDDVAIKIDKGTGKLTVSGTAPDATTTYAITATNKYGTSTPSATDGPRVTITIGLAPHGNNVEKSVGTTPSSPDPISATFKKGTFDNVTSASDYKICEIGATSSDQCSAVVNGLKITKNCDGSITVTGPAPPLAGDFTHSIIAINDYGSTEPSATGPRLTIHTGAAPIGKDVTVQPSGDVGPGDSIDLKVGSDTFSSTANITSYSLCSSSTDKSSCKTNLNGLSIDSNGHITGHAPTDSKGATLTEWIVAMNEYGQSQLSNKSPKVVIDTYSTDGPTIVASANGHWPLDRDHANKYTETITVMPSKGNSLDPNSVYSIASSPKLDARGGSYFEFFYHVDNSGATKTAQKVIVTFKNSKFDGVTLPDYYYLTISDKRGHKTTVDPIITFG